MPAKPSLVVFDTFARCFLGGEENSSSDVGLAIDSIDQLKQAIACCVLVVHHTNKAGEQERGSVALRGGADTMLALKEVDGQLSLSCDKQKDGRKPESIAVRLEPVGDTLVASAPRGARPSLSRTDLAFLDALATAFPTGPASHSQWRDASSKVGKDSKSSFYYARGRLLKHHLVAEEKVGNAIRYAVTPDGMMALAGKWNGAASPDESRPELTESLDSESRPRAAVQTPGPGGVNLPASLDRLDGGVGEHPGQGHKSTPVQTGVQSPDAVQTFDDQYDLDALHAEIDERFGMQQEGDGVDKG